MNANMNKTKKLAYLAVLTAVAMALSFLESQIPAFVAIPGVKIGLANIAVVFALYRFGAKEALLVSAVRIVAVSLLFGQTVSFFYSLAGGLFSFCLMAVLKRFTPFSSVGVSVAGGVAHNVGQILVAFVLLETGVVVYYLPFLILSGTLSGIVIGLLGGILVKRVHMDTGKNE